MTTLLDQYILATNSDFVCRISVTCAKAAIDVLGELYGGINQPTDAAHTKRVIWASETLRNPKMVAERMSIGVVSGGIITGSSSDSDLQWTINSLIDDYAGVD